MSKTEWKGVSIYKKLETVQLKELIDLKISEEVYNKIKYLCSKIPDVEWSGILMYSTEGSISKPKSLKIVIQDIFPMDKGSKAYTEYSFDDTAFIGYRMDNEESFDWKMGHIHSHNTMKTFFSGTDMEELEDNTKHHNYYVSLIVNNYMDLTAKVAFRGETGGEPVKYACKDENGKKYVIKDVSHKKDIMYHYNCNIITPEDTVTIPTPFRDRVEEIITIANEKDKRVVIRDAGFKYPGKVNTPVGNSHIPDERRQGNFWSNLPLANTPFDEEEEDDEPIGDSDEIVDFSRYILRLGNNDINGDTLDNVVEDLIISEADFGALTVNIVDQYDALYDKYFNEFGGNSDKDTYLTILEGVIFQMNEAEVESMDFEMIAEGLTMYKKELIKDEV